VVLGRGALTPSIVPTHPLPPLHPPPPPLRLVAEMTFSEKTSLFHGSCDGYTGNGKKTVMWLGGAAVAEYPDCVPHLPSTCCCLALCLAGVQFLGCQLFVPAVWCVCVCVCVCVRVSVCVANVCCPLFSRAVCANTRLGIPQIKMNDGPQGAYA
jgi:hypothetical protein